MPKRQVQRLVKLTTDFDKAVENLPAEKQEQYRAEQEQVADKRRRAQMSEGLLRLRVE